tara:strand:- start:69 stop:410 length:342 start_codon:yes stop_codon:yes gene_type:complete
MGGVSIKRFFNSLLYILIMRKKPICYIEVIDQSDKVYGDKAEYSFVAYSDVLDNCKGTHVGFGSGFESQMIKIGKTLNKLFPLHKYQIGICGGIFVNKFESLDVIKHNFYGID